ncbi:13883_t:CDS:1, partial [Dentiscutata erythropus]
MPQKTKKIEYCPAGHHSSEDSYSDSKNSVRFGNCSLCTREHFIQEFKTWSSGNANIDKIIQESQINNIYN